MADPELHLRGVATVVEGQLLQKLVIRTIEKTIKNRWSDFTQGSSGSEVNVDWTGLRREVESSLQRLARRELKSQPLVVFLLQTPEKPKVRTYRRRRRSATTVAS